MELKVWVDGVQRIVCGVTEVTTCQEVVIALAQAIGEYCHLGSGGKLFCEAKPRGGGGALGTSRAENAMYSGIILQCKLVALGFSLARERLKRQKRNILKSITFPSVKMYF